MERARELDVLARKQIAKRTRKLARREIERLGHGVYRHKDSLGGTLGRRLDRTLKEQLLVLDLHIPVGAVAKRPGARTCRARLHQALDIARKVVRLRALEGGAQCPVVSTALSSRGTPLAAVVEARDSRHAKEQAVGGSDARRVAQNGRQARDVVVVSKAQQVKPSVDAPRVATKLAVQ